MSEDPDKLQRAGKEALGDPTEQDPGRPRTKAGVDAAAPRSAKDSDDDDEGPRDPDDDEGPRDPDDDEGPRDP